MVPAILGGLLGMVGKPEGRKTFGAAVDAADTSLLGNVANMLGGSRSSSFIPSGLKLAPGLETAIATATAIPGVSDVLGDTLNIFRSSDVGRS